MKVLKRRRGGDALIAAGLLGVALLIPTAAQAARPPSIAFDPSSYDYGELVSGTTASKTFTLTNSGASATGALAVSLTGSSAFSKTDDTCTATSLGPKKSCSVTVQYSPTAAPATDSATLSAAGSKPTTTAAASLTGASITPSRSQIDCESFGGTFANGAGSTLWTCNGWPVSSEDEFMAKSNTLLTDCGADGGNGLDGVAVIPGTADVACVICCASAPAAAAVSDRSAVASFESSRRTRVVFSRAARVAG